MDQVFEEVTAASRKLFSAFFADVKAVLPATGCAKQRYDLYLQLASGVCLVAKHRNCCLKTHSVLLLKHIRFNTKPAIQNSFMA
ncbi:MAG: hypothetical protein R3C61_15015 [Bacteroidia bacterium]